MHATKIKRTKHQILVQLRHRCRSAGREHKRKLIAWPVELLDYHRKAIIRAMGAKPKQLAAVALLLGQSRENDPDVQLPILKPIWQAAF